MTPLFISTSHPSSPLQACSNLEFFNYSYRQGDREHSQHFEHLGHTISSNSFDYISDFNDIIPHHYSLFTYHNASHLNNLLVSVPPVPAPPSDPLLSSHHFHFTYTHTELSSVTTIHSPQTLDELTETTQTTGTCRILENYIKHSFVNENIIRGGTMMNVVHYLYSEHFQPIN